MATDPALPRLLGDADRALGCGDLTAAIDGYTRALAIRRDLPDAWFNLGWALRAGRRFDAALDAYAEAVQNGLSAPEHALVNRAAILSDHLFRRGDAIAELEFALTHNPRFVPALLGLGMAHEDAGDRPAAAAAYDRIVAIAPGNGRAIARLAALAMTTGDTVQAETRIRAALPIAATPLDRSDMLFALGAVLDAQQEHAAAFRAIDEANMIGRQQGGKRYDAAAMERLVDRLIRAFPAGTTRLGICPPAPDNPVFVCGMFRSGSTLVEQLLARHPALSAAGELEFIPALAQRWPDYPEAIGRLTAKQVAALRDAYLVEAPTGQAFLDKRCDNVLHIGLIRTLFPHSAIVHTVRHPLDTLLSVYFLPFGDGITYDASLGDAAHYYTQYRRIVAHWRAVFPDAIVDIDYDRLVRDPVPEVDRALQFLGLPSDPARSALPVTPDAVRTASNWQVRQPLHTRSSGRWRRYETQLAAAAEILRRAGLDPTSDVPIRP